MPCDYVAHCYALYYFIIYYGINDPLFSFLFSIVQYIPLFFFIPLVCHTTHTTVQNLIYNESESAFCCLFQNADIILWNLIYCYCYMMRLKMNFRSSRCCLYPSRFYYFVLLLAATNFMFRPFIILTFPCNILFLKILTFRFVSYT